MFLSAVDVVVIVACIIAVIVVVVVASSFRVVSQASAYVVERLGTYYKTWGTGIHFLTPIFCRVAKKVSLKEQVMDFDY